jgi:hypothetical protein
MSKKAIIVVQLVPEAEITDNKEIEKQIKEETSIPFCAKVEKVSIKSYRSERHHAMSHSEIGTT